MIRNLFKRAAVVLAALAAGAALVGGWKLPLGIIVGGALALLNFRGLERGLENLLGGTRPTMKLMFLGVFRLLILSAAIVLLAYSRAVDLIGLMAGFSVVVLLVLFEGFRASRAAG